MTQDTHRLPTNVVPTHYDLRLDVTDLELREVKNENGSTALAQNPYSGTVEIDVEILEPTDRIVLNAKQITIIEAALSDAADAPVVVAVETDEEHERVTLILNGVARVGSATLTLQFESVMETPTEAHGLYQSLYATGGEKKLMATTQFEATDARRCLPCFDEPALKATFRATLTVPSDVVALSNTDPVTVTDNTDGTKTVEFAETPVMSTYLLAFVIGDLVSIEQRTKRDVAVRIWSVRESIGNATFALQCATETLEDLEDYFETPYALGKLDNVAIPDFAAGAMENWGLVTYREQGVIVPPSASVFMKRYSASVIAHEIVHQWFGNLVTMGWWTYLWLNEAFATFVSSIVVDRFHPDWDAWDEFVAKCKVGGASLDSLQSSHPIEVEVEDTNQIAEIFDMISYQKGSAVLRMLETYTTPEGFRKGVVLYLRRNAYGNAATADLLQAMEDATELPVVEVFTPWLTQTGHPVLRLERDGATLTISQERFLLDRNPDVSNADTTMWPVPVSIVFGPDNDVSTFLLDGASTRIRLGAEDDAVLVNPGQTGFYRVRYDETSIRLLAEALAEGTVPTADRIGFFDDAYKLVRTGYLPVVDFLALVETNRDEKNHHVWGAMASGIMDIANVFSQDAAIERFKAWAHDLLVPIALELTWDEHPDDDDDIKQLRGSIMGAASNFGHEGSIVGAQERFAEHSDDISTLVSAMSMNVLPALCRVVAKHGDRETFDALCRLQQEATAAGSDLPPEVNIRLLQAITGSQDADLVRQGLAYGLNESFVRGNDAMHAFAGIRFEMTPTAWEFAQENWETLFARYGDNRRIGYFIDFVAGNLPNAEDADAIKVFFEKNPTPAAAMKIRQIVEGIQVRAAFRERNTDALTAFLDSLN